MRRIFALFAQFDGTYRSASRAGDETFPRRRFSDMTPEKGFAAQTNNHAPGIRS